jgi:hypothetical protein
MNNKSINIWADFNDKTSYLGVKYEYLASLKSYNYRVNIVLFVYLWFCNEEKKWDFYY